jgi:DNA-binding response OmpR family regulator
VAIVPDRAELCKRDSILKAEGLMPKSLVLIAETTTAFTVPLRKHYTTHLARSGKQGISAVLEHAAELIIVDAVSLGTTGERICKQIRQAFPEHPIIHIHPKSGSKVETTADVVLFHPVTSRSLLSHIRKLSSKKNEHLLKVAHFQLDSERRVLFVREKEIQLTPKQSALVEAFLRHPNEILERKWLMQQIWNTDYTGDTRTLNVHVRFVRELMEKDASDPRYIQTVRGVGYRFELPKQKKTDP